MASKSDSKKVSVLVSGGVESAAILLANIQAGGEVHPVYVRAGHRWEQAELFWLKRLIRALRSPRLRPLAILDLPIHDAYLRAKWSFSGRRVPSARMRDESVYLPGRNILLLAKAAVFSSERSIPKIVLGTLGSNPFPDASPSFFRLIARAFSTGLDIPLSVEIPFGRLHKEQVLARMPGVPWQFTFSCISPLGLRHCGRCNKCGERKKAFRAAGLKDPTQYA